MTFQIPRPEWVSDRLIEDPECGPNAQFQMYSREGNDACAKLVLDLAERASSQLMMRGAIIEWLKNGVAIVALTHPEIHDTEPEWAIVDAVNAYLNHNGFMGIDRDDLS